MVIAVENYFTNKKKYKVPGIGLQLDGLGWCIVVMVIAAIVVGGIFAMRHSSRVAGTKLELGEIQTAILQYEGHRIDGQPPASLSVLLSNPSISAADAIDGMDHDAFLPSTNNRWASGKLTDLWSVEYQYTVNADKSGTVTSVGSGKSIPINF